MCLRIRAKLSEELFINFLHALLSVGQRDITAQMEVLYKAFPFFASLFQVNFRFQDHVITCTRFLNYNRAIIIISGPAPV